MAHVARTTNVPALGVLLATVAQNLAVLFRIPPIGTVPLAAAK